MAENIIKHETGRERDTINDQAVLADTRTPAAE
jgi:hypothetical protein